MNKETVLVYPLILCGILGALSNCSPRQLSNGSGAEAPGALRSKNAVVELPAQAQGLAPPSEGDAWVLVVNTSAGFSGDGAGGVVITSRGDAAAWHPSTEFRRPCRAELSREALREVVQSTTLAEPERWSASYVDPQRPHGAADDLSTELTLYRRRSDGTEQYVSRWYEVGSAHMRPNDLAAIHEAATKIKGRVLGACVESSQGSSGG